MIYDAFTFFNEVELLEIRLNELKSVVDKFVICESTYTHAGNPKPLNFNIKNYPEFEDRIIYLIDDSVPNKSQVDVTKHIQFKGGPAWDNENHQRNYLNEVLGNADDKDVIMISDLDEIPSARGVQEAIDILKFKSDLVIACEHKTYYYMLNYYVLDYVGTKIMTGATYRKNMKSSPQLARLTSGGAEVHTLKDGWHFGWLGGIERIRYKFKEFAHQEYTKEDKVTGIINNIDNMIDMWDRKLQKVEIDTSFPQYLLEHQDRFARFIDRS